MDQKNVSLEAERAEHLQLVHWALREKNEALKCQNKFLVSQNELLKDRLQEAKAFDLVKFGIL